MMPPEQETNTPISLANRSENAWVHAEPSGSTTTDASPRLEAQMPDQQQANSARRFSILHRSLRPVTLKVHISVA